MLLFDYHFFGKRCFGTVKFYKVHSRFERWDVQLVGGASLKYTFAKNVIEFYGSKL